MIPPGVSGRTWDLGPFFSAGAGGGENRMPDAADETEVTATAGTGICGAPTSLV